VFICVHLWLLSLVFPISAQVRPVNDYGALGLAQLLKRLNTTASVMMIGAHPDDEDSALLAYLARGESARTAYLSLTRGEGGQNLIGPELGEALGILRTEELLQARRLDGAEQYFTRAYDYGFSKTLAEAKSKWPEDVIKCDVVRAIRMFRPLVVISRFTGTPADGHGHHQYAGYISPIAVKAAADPQQCTDAGTPWQVLKFYVEQSFNDTSQPTLKINTGQYDPILGRSYYEIAMEGRSMHRSQGEGRLELHGDQFSGLKLVSAQAKTEKSPFDGLDTTIRGIASLTNNSEDQLASKLGEIQRLIDSGSSKYCPFSPEAIIHDFSTAFRMANDAQLSTQNGQTREMLIELSNEIGMSITQAVGIQMDTLSDKEWVVPGENLNVAVKVYYPKASGVAIKEVSLIAPVGWQTTRTDAPKDNSPGYVKRESANATDYFSVNVPTSVELSQPYWLEKERVSDLFQWPDGAEQNRAFQSALPMWAAVTLAIDGSELALRQQIQFRYADPARGEIRRDVNVVPALSVSLDRRLIVESLNPAKSHDRQVVMTLINNSDDPVEGVASLTVNSPGWQAVALRGADFLLKNKGQKTNVSFTVTIPRGVTSGSYSMNGNAVVRERSYNDEMHTIVYSHIQTHRYYTPANATIEILDLKTTPARIGYIMGSGDEVPEAIRQMGMDVTMLEEKDLASSDLSRFDTIVVGIRASETRSDMMANKQRLMDYVNNGGNLIMQYQRGDFAHSGLPPYPVDTKDKQGTTAGDVARVVDENAPVKILDSASPIFNFPNKITDEDFKGWVQERNAYNLVTFDPKYTPLLESHDAGEQENKGGLVIAKVGKGNWVYCSYSFFRQLPAGVPGAYRLFANLLSLPKGK
jgi:LmbE family N-acetylglucosaminyl deacetylase